MPTRNHNDWVVKYMIAHRAQNMRTNSAYKLCGHQPGSNKSVYDNDHLQFLLAVLFYHADILNWQCVRFSCDSFPSQHAESKKKNSPCNTLQDHCLLKTIVSYWQQSLRVHVCNYVMLLSQSKNRAFEEISAIAKQQTQQRCVYKQTRLGPVLTRFLEKKKQRDRYAFR